MMLFKRILPLLVLLSVALPVSADTYLEVANRMVTALKLEQTDTPLLPEYGDYALVEPNAEINNAAYYGFLGFDGLLRPNTQVADYTEFAKPLTKFTFYNKKYHLVKGIWQQNGVTDTILYQKNDNTVCLTKNAYNGVIPEGTMVIGLANIDKQLLFVWEPKDGLPYMMVRGSFYISYNGHLVIKNPERLLYGNFSKMGELYYETSCRRYVANGRQLTEDEAVETYLDQEIYALIAPDGAVIAQIF